MDSIKKILKLAFGVAALLLVAPSVFAEGEKPQNLPKKTFAVCGKKLKLEIAKSESERAKGLMHRVSVQKGTGMIFVFDQANLLSFWMRNVPFDIDIGYFDSKGKLLNTYTMKGTSPLMKDEALPRYPSGGDALFAVEVQAGFYNGTKKKSCRLSPITF